MLKNNNNITLWLQGNDPEPLLHKDGIWMMKTWKHLQTPPQRDPMVPLSLLALLVMLAFVIPLLGWSAPSLNSHTKQLEWIQIPVLKHSMRLGEVITEEDITTRKMLAERVNPRVVKAAEELTGLEVHRHVRAGMPIYLDYVRVPPTIRKNSMVEMVFAGSGIAISGGAKALQDAQTGQSIKVQNSRSGQIINGIAMADGRVMLK